MVFFVADFFDPVFFVVFFEIFFEVFFAADLFALFAPPGDVNGVNPTASPTVISSASIAIAGSRS